MKTKPWDFLFCSLFFAVVLFVDLFVLRFIRVFTTRWFLEYHIVIDAALFVFFFGLFSMLLLRFILFLLPLKEGEYSLDSAYASYWKFYSVVHLIAGMHILSSFFPAIFKPIFYKICGAKIGKEVAMGGELADPFWIEIGKGCILGQDSVITSHAIVADKIILKKVKIKDKAVVGINSVVMPGVEIGEGSLVLPGSVVVMDTHVPKNEVWAGAPAKKIKDAELSDL